MEIFRGGGYRKSDSEVYQEDQPHGIKELKYEKLG